MKTIRLLLVILFSFAVVACGGGGGSGGGNAGGGAISATANITAQNLTVGTAMTSFSPLTASGGTAPYTYSYTGTLPTGLSFNTGTGAVTGTPTAAYAAANLVFSVKDANNVTASTTSTVSFSVTVGTGAATGVTFSGTVGGYNSVANTSMNNNFVLGTGGHTYTTGASYIWNDANGFTTATLNYDSANNLIIVGLGSPLGYGTTCGVNSNATYAGVVAVPACSSVGITFNKAAGMITFTSTAIWYGALHVPGYVGSTSTGITATGSLSFAPF